MWLDTTSTGRLIFRVTGAVEVPDLATQAELVLRAEPAAGSRQIELDVVTTRGDGGQPVATALAWREVSFSYPGQRIRSASIFHDDRALASITVEVTETAPSEVDLGIPGLSDHKEIGSGGFGIVYSAFETDAGRWVAVKVLTAVDERGRRRFDRERRTMGQTTAHDNIVTMFRSGYTDPGNRPYLVMEYMSGGSLQDHINTHGPLPIDEAMALIVPVARGLEFAHTTGIVHNDIKPANILISATGAAKLADFGIAAVRDATGIGTVAFSLAYTAPETFDAVPGPDGAMLDPRHERSDLYSLAATLYALIAGRPPFTADNQAALMRQILTEDPPSTGHDTLDAFFTVALAKNPEDRYLTTVQFIHALTTATSPAPAPPADPEPPRQHTTIVAPPIKPPSAPSHDPDPRASTRPTSTDHTTIVAPRQPPHRQGTGALALPRQWLWIATATALAIAAVVAIIRTIDDGSTQDTPSIDQTTEPTTGDAIPDTDPPIVTNPPTETTAVPVRLPITYTGHNEPVWSVVQLDNGHIASAGTDNTVQIWDPANPEATIATYTGHKDIVASVVQLDNGNIASASFDGTVQIWDHANPEATIATYTGHNEPVVSMVQLDNGNIASASDDGVRIWDPANPEATIATYTGHNEPVWSVVELDNGNIASASDGGVRIWDPANPEATIATYTGHNEPVWSVVELDNGNIASASADGSSGDGTVRIWDPANPEATIATYTGHSWLRSVVQLDNGNIASAGADGSSGDGTVRIWDPANPEATIATYTGHNGWVVSMVQLDNGNIASASFDGTVQIWDPANP